MKFSFSISVPIAILAFFCLLTGLLWADDSQLTGNSPVSPTVSTDSITPTAKTGEAAGKMEEVVVTARRVPESYSQVPENISVVTSRQLLQMPVNDLAQTLNLIPGVDIQTRGQFGQPATISIQGSDPRHVRVMVDGVLLNAQGMAFADPSQIPIENVERIEVVKGTGSAVWGSSLGGVINVITKAPRGNRLFQGDLTLSGGGGAYGFSKEILSMRGKTDKLNYLVWGSFLSTNNELRVNSEIENQKAGGKVTYFLSDKSNLEASYNYDGSKTGNFEYDAALPSNYYGETFQENLVYTAHYGSIKFVTVPSDDLEFNATAKMSQQDSRVMDSLMTSNGQVNTGSKDNFMGLDLQTKLQLQKNQSVLVGTDLGRDGLDSTVILKSVTSNRQGYYGNYNLLLGEEYSFTLGARYDNNQAYGSQFSPSVGVVYHLGIWQTDLRASVAGAFNAPPLIYKYINDPFLLPNPDLKAERSPGVYEIGTETKPLEKLSVKASVYRAGVRDLVNFNNDFVNPMMINISRVRRQGFETGADYQLLDGLLLKGSCSFNRVVDLDAGAELQGTAAAKMNYALGANYTLNRFNFNLQGNYKFWNSPPSFNPNDRKFLWDARVNYTLSDKKGDTNAPMAFVAVYNLFGTKFWYDSIFPYPGRLVEFGIKYSF